MTPGPMDFRGPIMGPVGFRGPSRMTLRNQYVQDRRPFFLWRSHENPEKTAAFFLEDIFFEDRIKIQRQLAFSPSVLEYTKPEMPNI